MLAHPRACGNAGDDRWEASQSTPNGVLGMTGNPKQNPLSPRQSAPAAGGSRRANAIRVVLIEDDEHYRNSLISELSERGFAVQSFADGESILDSLHTVAESDVILLDWNLPKISGIDLLPQLRRHGVRLPVIFLTVHTGAAYESLAFERGAADFIDKQRGVQVLVRRLERVVEAGKSTAHSYSQKKIAVGKLVLHSTVSQAYWNDFAIDLTVGEYRIVHLLATNAGRYVPARTIYDQFHHRRVVSRPDDHGYRTNVRTMIKRIRRKFRECDPAFAEIQNFVALGYCWNDPHRR